MKILFPRGKVLFVCSFMEYNIIFGVVDISSLMLGALAMNIKGRTRFPFLGFGVAIGIFAFWALSWASSSNDSIEFSGVVDKEKGESNNDDYWNSERLRKAKPLDLPHPKGTEDDLNGLLNQDPNKRPSPHTEEGSPGDRTIVPDTSNLLFVPVEPSRN